MMALPVEETDISSWRPVEFSRFPVVRADIVKTQRGVNLLVNGVLCEACVKPNGTWRPGVEGKSITYQYSTVLVPGLVPYRYQYYCGMVPVWYGTVPDLGLVNI